MLLRNAQGLVDGSRGLAVIGIKHVSVYRKGDARLGVPQTLRDRDNIDPGGDQLRRMSVPQRMERNCAELAARPASFLPFPLNRIVEKRECLRSASPNANPEPFRNVRKSSDVGSGYQFPAAGDNLGKRRHNVPTRSVRDRTWRLSSI